MYHEDIMAVIGTQQSPIDIVSTEAYHVPALKAIKFHYNRDLAGQIVGHNFVFHPPLDPNQAKPWSISVRGTVWLIRQIHMHSPAEHRIDGCAPTEFEVHLVHSLPSDPDAKGAKLVVGVFAKPGSAKQKKGSLHDLAKHFKERKSEAEASEPFNVDPRDFLPDDDRKSFYHYEGSLTGDPYSEDVSWFVMKDDTIVSKADFEELKDHAEHSARGLQPLNRRFVLKNFK